MTIEKPSRNEDEYFAREEAERLSQLRAHEAAERIAAERLVHRMRCPKCGGHLHTEAFHDVEVDRCPDCHGIWLDSHEVESLMKDDDHGVLRKVMSDVWASLQRLRAGA